MVHVTAVIPARLASKRFSRKVLYPLKGKPLIYYVWKAAAQAKLIDRLFVATDSADIGRAVTAFGGAVIMTSGSPRNGTERVAEATAEIKTDIVINIQADNVGLTGRLLDRVIGAMVADRTIATATLARRIEGPGWRKKLDDPNVVKVIAGANDEALWFSRYPIPYIKNRRGKKAVDCYPYLEHIGVYFFRRRVLQEYAGWPPGRAERAESLEQLRLLEHGHRPRVFITRVPVVSVDSREAVKKLTFV